MACTRCLTLAWALLAALSTSHGAQAQVVATDVCLSIISRTPFCAACGTLNELMGVEPTESDLSPRDRCVACEQGYRLSVVRAMGFCNSATKGFYWGERLVNTTLSNGTVVTRRQLGPIRWGPGQC
jgi:hypothetical protein